MSTYYNGSQDREWPGSEQDPDWCYVCDRPKNDCACHLCEKAGCTKDAAVIVAFGELECQFCDHHGAEAIVEHDGSLIERLDVETKTWVKVNG